MRFRLCKVNAGDPDAGRSEWSAIAAMTSGHSARPARASHLPLLAVRRTSTAVVWGAGGGSSSGRSHGSINFDVERPVPQTGGHPRGISLAGLCVDLLAIAALYTMKALSANMLSVGYGARGE